MRTNHPSNLILLIVLCLAVASCTPADPSSQATVTVTTSSNSSMPELSVIWPANKADCVTSLPAPTLQLCFPEDLPPSIKVSIPAALVPGVEQGFLGTLPGGSWSTPIPISLGGLSESGISQVGIIIINTSPAPDAAVAGIVIVNNAEGQAGIIIINNFPQPGTAEGIIIVDTKPSEESGVGLVELSIPGLEPGQPAGDKAYTGEIISLAWLDPLESVQTLSEGIVWGGLVSLIDDNYVANSPLTDKVEFLIDDNKPSQEGDQTAIVWGGMPADAFGIVIVNTIPGPDHSSEGIIIVHGKNASQVMGAIVEDMPSTDENAEGIVIVNNKPAEFNSPGISMDGIFYAGLPDADLGSEGIIIVGGMPAAYPVGTAISNFGFPEGFGMPEGMMPFIGENGFGPFPFALLSLDLSELEATAAQGNCYQIALSQITSTTSGGTTLPTDSFFDVFTNLTVGVPQAGTDTNIITKVVPISFPDFVICTPEPGSGPPTPTAPTSPMPPTATTRTGLPTCTPTSISRYPTDTPEGRSAP